MALYLLFSLTSSSSTVKNRSHGTVLTVESETFLEDIDADKAGRTV